MSKAWAEAYHAPSCRTCDKRKVISPNTRCWHCLWQDMREQYMRDYL